LDSVVTEKEKIFVMRFSKLFAPTLKEDPAEAEIVSHKLLVRAGMLRKVASGIYSYLPLGFRVLNKVINIVREEMDRAGAEELLMSALQPAEIWQKSGRWAEYGPEMMRLKDRGNRDFCLGPTHEELITTIVMNEMISYRQLPVTLYQIQVKFRDEIRPRFGLMRGREFIMKDAYSFDPDEKSLRASYEKMYDAYSRIFERCGLKYRAVEAESGLIGGDISQEFMVLADTGEEAVVYCDKCSYAASREAARTGKVEVKKDEPETLEEVNTPGQKTISEVSGFLKTSPKNIVKTLFYQTEDGIKAVLVRGDREVNQEKLNRVFGTGKVSFLSNEDFNKYPNLIYGYMGPINLGDHEIIGDNEVLEMRNFITGANKIDTHFINANVDRDFKVDRWGDFVFVNEGDKCPCCEGTLKITRGIEVGHVFQLGDKYSKAMNATFLDENGKRRFYTMGCYGIGVSRLVQATIEQNHDEAGIVWPLSLAPFEVIIIVLNTKDKEQSAIAEDIYTGLLNKGIEVIIDDREESAGRKFADADLIGFPYHVIIGKKTKASSRVELKVRKNNQKMEVSLGSAVEDIRLEVRG
jgi:prolyl-tRNA synthetase